MSSVRRLLTAFFFLLLALLFWKLRIVDTAVGGTRASYDLLEQVYPMSHRAAEWLREGRIPLWNPFQLAGEPFLATVQYGVLYPLNFTYLLLPTAVAMEVTTILHFFLAGVFAYLFGRAIGLERVGSAATGVVFMFSAPLVQLALWFTPIFTAAVWLPLLLLAIEQVAAAPRPGPAALFAVCAAMSFLAGGTQIWTYEMYAAMLYGLVRVLWPVPPRDRKLAVALALGGGLVLGVLLVAVQLLPGLELEALSPRRLGVLSPAQLMPLGPLTPRGLVAQMARSVPGRPSLAYMGSLPLVLAPLSLLWRRRVPVLYLWGLAAFSVMLALAGSVVPVWLYRLLPGLSWYRFPQRILLLYAFCIAALAGVGLQVLVDALRQSGRRARYGPLALLTLVAVTWWLAAGPGLTEGAFLAAGVGLAWFAGFVGKGRGIAASRVAVAMLSVVALVGLMAANLFVALRGVTLRPFQAESRLYDSDDVVSYLAKNQGLYRTYVEGPEFYGIPYFGLMPKQGTLRGLYMMTDYEPLTLSRFARLYRFVQGGTVAEGRRPPFGGDLRLGSAAQGLRLLDLLSVRFAVGGAHSAVLHILQQRPADWRPVPLRWHNKFIAVYQRVVPMPRAYVAYRTLRAAGEDEAFSLLTAPGFEMRQSVVVEGAPAAERPPEGMEPIHPARITSYRPTRVAVEADAPSAGLLVLTDTFYPGWKATVDGAPAPIYRANYLFRAVPVGPGRHTVVFDYEPRSFRIGAWMSFAGLMLVVGCWVWGKRRGLS